MDVPSVVPCALSKLQTLKTTAALLLRSTGALWWTLLGATVRERDGRAAARGRCRLAGLVGRSRAPGYLDG